MGAPVKKREKKREKKGERKRRERERERGGKTVEGVECERGGVK